MKSCAGKVKEHIKADKKDLGKMLKADKKLATAMPMGKRGTPKKVK